MKLNKPILLVEDDTVDAMMVKKAFKQLNIVHPLVIKENGEQALEWLQDEDEGLPGLILLDLNMPRMNGLEFLKVAKSDDKLKVIPVVVLTTSEDQQDRVESFSHSVAGYMIKSFDYHEFLETIRGINQYWDMSERAY
ncbi:MAG: response regulator [Bacteroidia bacterium]